MPWPYAYFPNLPGTEHVRSFVTFLFISAQLLLQVCRVLSLAANTSCHLHPDGPKADDDKYEFEYHD